MKSFMQHPVTIVAVTIFIILAIGAMPALILLKNHQHKQQLAECPAMQQEEQKPEERHYMNNDEIIQETHHCESAGLVAKIYIWDDVNKAAYIMCHPKE